MSGFVIEMEVNLVAEADNAGIGILKPVLFWFWHKSD